MSISVGSRSLWRKLSKFIFIIRHSFSWVFAGCLPPHIYGSIGEDAVIEHHLFYAGKDIWAHGAYVDIGGYHPISLSNTFRFYGKAKIGFVVDVGSFKKALFRLIRPKDIFIDRALVPDCYTSDTIDFLQSGFYGSGVDSVSSHGVDSDYRNSIRQRTVTYRCITASALTSIIISHSEWHSAAWRVLNIDIEGLDEIILKDMDLHALNCDVIAAECFPPTEVPVTEYLNYYINESSMVSYMKSCSYSLASVVGPTLIFVRVT